MTTPTAARGALTAPRPRRLLARARRHALVAVALLGVLTLTAACTGTASATQFGRDDSDRSSGSGDRGNRGGQDDTNGIVCPDVASLLTDVPGAAQAEVDRELANLENQLARADERLANSVGQGGPNFVQNAILGPLSAQRAAVLDRVRIAIERAGGEAPDGLLGLSQCALEDGDDGGDNGDGGDDGDNGELNEDEQRLLELVPGIQLAGDIVNGNRTLGQDCSVSDLPRHDGFESDDAVCVDLAAGEQPALEKGAQLLIVDFPQVVETGEPFSYTVSTRNLLRARFLGAADGGYYAETSVLDNDGNTLGHFHTGCRPLATGLGVAPDPAVLPDFFQAVEDFGGGSDPDFVEIEVAEGLPQPGLYQCAAWAGDPSHRVPMMARAQQFPAFDTFLLEVR